MITTKIVTVTAYDYDITEFFTTKIRCLIQADCSTTTRHDTLASAVTALNSAYFEADTTFIVNVEMAYGQCLILQYACIYHDNLIGDYVLVTLNR
jgi:hypothetical protein